MYGWKKQIIQLQNEKNWHAVLQLAKRWIEAKPSIVGWVERSETHRLIEIDLPTYMRDIFP